MDELPYFYNIVLERPRDDPTGYDCLFIDAASKVRGARTARCAALSLAAFSASIGPRLTATGPASSAMQQGARAHGGEWEGQLACRVSHHCSLSCQAALKVGHSIE